MNQQPGTHIMRPVILLTIVLCSSPIGTALSQREGVQLLAEPGRTIRDSRGGGGQAFRINSSMLGQTRRINVVLPPSFSQTGANRRYPVVIVLDGEANVAPIAAVADELTRHGLIPEMIYVGIDNIGGNSGRVYDLTPPGLSVSGSDLNQGGDRFLDFIEKELLPAVDRQLRGGAPRLMIGHSSGAILATYAAATRPAFLGVVAIDGPLQFQDWWLVKRLASRSSTPDASPLRYVFLESTAGLRNFGWPDKVWNDLVAATPKNWMLYREKLRHEGHESMVFPAAYAGLKEIFSDYSRMTASTRTAAEMLAHYRSVSESFGATLTPPSRVLRETITDLLSESQGGAAREAFELLVAGYGAPEDSAGLAADIAEVESAPRPTETVADLLATPFPTPTQVERYAGEWVGDVWMESGQPRTGDFRLRVRVDEGKVIAETRNANAPPELAGWIPVQYLKVTPQGLTWGRMNGMRPRGVALWEGRLSGDTLSGTMRFGGIVFEYPESMSPGFLLVRVRR